MSVLVVKVDADTTGETEACSDWLFQLGAQAIEERFDDNETVLIAGFVSDDAALAARSLLGERWACRLEDTGDEASWRDEWLRHLEPISIGDLTVHAPWHDMASHDPARLISVDPGRAFGSGHHPTTRLAIGHLCDIVQPGDTVLDVGCGTGILSIVAARRHARQVVAVDLDHDALVVAEANIDANGCGDIVELVEPTGFDWYQRFDVVVANIVIGDLRPMLGRLLAATDRHLVVTGFLDQQRSDLLAPHAANPIDLASLDGWSSAVLAPGAPAHESA